MKTEEQKKKHADYMRRFYQEHPEQRKKASERKKFLRSIRGDEIRAREMAGKHRNRDAVLLSKKRYRKKCAAKIREYNAAYMNRNPELMRAWRAKWVVANPHLVIKKQVERRKAEIRAMPLWADRKAINAVYLHRKEITELTGVQYHVDHIYPLRGATVSGLHVSGNLQVIPSNDNFRKSNRCQA